MNETCVLSAMLQVRSLDEQAFTLEQLNSLKESLPQDDEVKTLKAYTGDTTKLGAVSSTAWLGPS